MNNCSESFELHRKSIREEAVESIIANFIGQDQNDEVFANELKKILNNYGQDLFYTETGCLLAKFAVLFGYSVLDEQKRIFLLSGLKKEQKKYQALVKLNKKITKLRKKVHEFYEKDDRSEIFSVLKTEYSLVNQIIKTDILRIMRYFLEQKKCQATGFGSSFALDLIEKDDSYVVQLSKA